MARVLLDDVTKVFAGKVTAVDRASLEIQDGEFMVIVGPSGCGKTTTLRMVAGLEDVTSGQIFIGDKIVNDVPPKDRDIAMVFQNYALYPHMTVYQNLAFGLKLRKIPKAQIKAKVGETATLLGINELLMRKPKSLSGGQRQRVALGRAIIRNPQVFLYDEPLSNLDAKLRVQTRAELKALHHRLQTTSVYVTHDQAEAMTLGGRICIMCEGIIQQVAEPMEVYRQPVNKFVAGFLGTPPMNFFSGSVQVQNEAPAFAIGSEVIELPRVLKAALNNYHQKEMVAGIRPEDLSLSPYDGQSTNTLAGQVALTEPLGDRIDVTVALDGGEKAIVTVDPHMKVQTNDKATIYLDVTRVHVFEPGDMGRNVLQLAKEGSK